MNTKIINKLKYYMQITKQKCIDDLVNEGFFDPDCTIIGRQGSECIEGHWPDDANYEELQFRKRTFANEVRAQSVLSRADTVIFRAEAWGLPDGIKESRPSMAKDRVERVIISVEEHSGYCKAFFDIVRSPQGIFCGLKKKSIKYYSGRDISGGICSAFLPPIQLYEVPEMRALALEFLNETNEARVHDQLLRSLSTGAAR